MESPAEDAYYSLAKKFVFFRLETSFFRLIIKEFGFVQRKWTNFYKKETAISHE